MMELDLDIEPFDWSDFEIEQKKEQQRRAKAIAKKTKTRRQIRRARSEDHLAEILPPHIPPGESWHVLSQGDVDSLSYLTHLAKGRTLDYVAFSTWCMAVQDVADIQQMVESGQIQRLDAYMGEIFPNQYADAYEGLCKTVRSVGGRACVFRNHAKIFLVKSGVDYWVVESSANINTNPRAENTVITADRALFMHLKTFFDGVRSFERNFDDWQPAEID